MVDAEEIQQVIRVYQVALLVFWIVGCGSGSDPSRDPAEYARLKVQVEDTTQELDARLKTASSLTSFSYRYWR